MDNTNEHTSKPLTTASLVGIGVFSILFILSVRAMIPRTERPLFYAALCFGGFFIPLIPEVLRDKCSTFLAVIAYIILSIPIVLWGIFWVKYAIIANHNYVIPKAEKILFTVEEEWELLENDGVGNEWKKGVNITADLRDELPENEHKYHLASINSDIIAELVVREDDKYDDEEYEERGFDYDPDEIAYNDILFPATFNFGKSRSAKATVTLYEFNHSEDDGVKKAVWEGTVTLKRVFEYWEVLLADLDYYSVDWKLAYTPEVIGKKTESWVDIRSDDLSLQAFPHGYNDYIYDTYESVDMEYMESSAISEAGYSEEFGYLLVRFAESDSLYAYLRVPLDTYWGFFDTESPGRYFNEEIKGKYDYLNLE